MKLSLANLKTTTAQVIKGNDNKDITGDKDQAIRFNDYDSFLNKVDGGYTIDQEAGYSTDITLSGNRRAFASVGFVDDAITAASVNAITALTGDGTATGPGTATFTLATVNSNVGTFNNVTVDGKGRVTAASNVTYLTTISGITAGGDLTGTYPNPTVVWSHGETTYDARYLQLSGGTLTGNLNGVTPTEINYLSGTMSNIQSQLNALTTGYGGGKPEVRAATTGNITLLGTQTVDSIALAVGDRVLVKDQTAQLQNGIYIVSLTTWTRATDSSTGGATPNTTSIFGSNVQVAAGGTANGSTFWGCSNSSSITIGTTAINYTKLSSTTYTGSNGIALVGNNFIFDSTYVTGDITVTTLGVTAIGANKVTNAMLRQSAGLSIIGRSANSTGNVADIVAGTDATVLSRLSSVVGFNSIASILGYTPDNSLNPTGIKIANYNIVANDFVLFDTTSGSLTGTLPNAPADKTRVAVKQLTRGGTNTVTVAASGSDVINKAGTTSLTVTLSSQGVMLQYQASTLIWFVVSSDIPLSQLDLRFESLTNKVSDFTTVNTTLYPNTQAVYNIKQPVLAKYNATYAHTGVTTETVMAVISIPAGMVGANDINEIYAMLGGTNSAGAKTMRGYFVTIAPTVGATFTGTPTNIFFTYGFTTGVVSAGRGNVMICKNSQTSQLILQGASTATNQYTIANVAPTALSIDFTVQQYFVVTGQLGTTTDTLNLYGLKIDQAR